MLQQTMGKRPKLLNDKKLWSYSLVHYGNAAPCSYRDFTSLAICQLNTRKLLMVYILSLSSGYICRLGGLAVAYGGLKWFHYKRVRLPLCLDTVNTSRQFCTIVNDIATVQYVCVNMWLHIRICVFVWNEYRVVWSTYSSIRPIRKSNDWLFTICSQHSSSYSVLVYNVQGSTVYPFAY